MRSFFFLAFIWVSFPALSSAQANGSYELTVLVDQFRSDSGQVMVELKDSGKKRISAQKASINDGISRIGFEGLEKGKYAVRLFHDANLNEELDRKGVVPKEGYGYSNNVKGKMGPPNFSEQLFDLEKDTTLRIHVIYMRE